MLQDIRQYTRGTTAKVVIGLIVISFAFFGIQSILVSGGDNEVAQVNGEDIYAQELQQAVDVQKRQLIGMMGDNFDPTMLDDDYLTPRALETLINRKLQMQSAEAMNLTISDREIGAVVVGMEQFQIDGTFSPELYKSVISNAGFSPGFFKVNLRNDLLVNQVSSGLAGSEFVTPSELALNARIMAEQRDLRFFVIPLEKFRQAMPVSGEEAQLYYDAHRNEFRTPESVDIDYLQLTLDDFRQPVPESAVIEAYELASDELQYKTQNRVSHILFESQNESGIQQRIQAAQDKLASGVAFAEVAQEYSDDAGSAEKGGDLGYSSGEAFPEAMEEAIAELEPGIVSAAVETEAGTHLILVTERKPAEVPSLDDMRAELEEAIQADEAHVALLRAVESLRDLSFNAEDLGEPAKALDISVKRIVAVARDHSEGLFASPALLEAAFSEDVLEAGHNSDVIELAGNTFVVLRVHNHNQPEMKPLESVIDQVHAAIADEKARNAVNAEAERVLQQLRNGETLEQVASFGGYEVDVELAVDRRSGNVPQEVLSRAFEMPAPESGHSLTDFLITPDGDAIVVELFRVNVGEYTSLLEEEQQQLQKLLTGEYGSLVFNQYRRGLRESAEITVL